MHFLIGQPVLILFLLSISKKKKSSSYAEISSQASAFAVVFQDLLLLNLFNRFSPSSFFHSIYVLLLNILFLGFLLLNIQIVVALYS